jgi:uncharacterized protein (DUF302 family)
MFTNLGKLCSTLLIILPMAALEPAIAAEAPPNGIVKVKSAYPMAETIVRLKEDIAAKGIKFFAIIDQAQLASEAGIKLRPSALLIFGNPPLGAQFLTSNPDAGLDWPVRLLVRQDEDGVVWAGYSDFSWIARRFEIKDRDAQFEMAATVVASIASSVAMGSPK